MDYSAFGKIGFGNDEDSSLCRGSAEASSLAAYWNTMYHLASNLPSMFVIPFIGVFLDMLGRKWVAVMGTLGNTLVIGALVLIEFGAPIWLLFLASFMSGCMGGYQVRIAPLFRNSAVCKYL
jgi:MFS family permease